jgi:hypothetical protein
MGDAVFYIMLVILVGVFYWITRINSRRHANMLLLVAALSVVVSQIKGLQMFSLLGILGVLGIMVASRFSRDKDIGQWLADRGFTIIPFTDAAELFAHLPNDRSASYTTYQGKVSNQPCIFSVRYHSYRSGNTTSLVVHCTYCFPEKTGAETLVQRFLNKKENTPKAPWYKSQLGYFNLNQCEIFKPTMGGIAVCWRLPTTIAGYQERYDWVEEALAGWR